MIGAQGSPYLSPEQWQFNFGWRYQYSDRHFTGTTQDQERDRENSQVKNTIHQLNFGRTYGWDEQTQVTINLPYYLNERSSLDNDFPGERRYVAAHGIGDLSVVFKHWWFDTKTSTDTNFGIGYGLKLPTGEPNLQDSVKVLEDFVGDGQKDAIRIRGSTVDQSIQPGDGGFGRILDVEWFKQVGDFTPYAYAGWTFTPEGNSGVQTGRSRDGERVMSIADSYIGRLGSMWAVTDMEGLSLGAGLRIEGVPVYDPIGKDDGFRRPGYALSAEPSAVLARGRDVFSLSVPIALVRNRHRSVSDKENHRHGDAAFADYVLIFGWSRRF